MSSANTHRHRCNKALHPTAYASVVPPFAPAAGELGRCVAAPADGKLQAIPRQIKWLEMLAPSFR